MKYSLSPLNTPVNDSSDCIIIPVFSQDKKFVLSESAQMLDQSSASSLSTLLDNGDFDGSAEKTMMLYGYEGIKAPRLLLIGCGEQEKFDSALLSKVTKKACQEIQGTSIETVSFYGVDELPAKDQAIMQIILAFADCQYTMQDYKSEPKDENKLIEVKLVVNQPTQTEQDACNQASAIAEGMQLSRNLANYPANVCTPTFLANTAQELAAQYDQIESEILEEKDMEELGMGAFLSVSKGSDEPGKLIILQYHGAKNQKQPPVALVGKGVTFDTGGISLKPSANMDEMKFDMSGAASMLGTLKACAAMKLNINLVVALAATENMPSGRATKPGDIVTSMQGTTIEVLNTDAEGRLVLCDTLTYIGRYKPELVIDAATLTGACIVALGHHISAVLANDDTLADELIAAGEQINDPVWRLPMNEDYKKQLKSAFADLGNIGGKGAGTITAACFLGEFTKDYKWAHLDIAGTAWTDKDSTGRPVPLLSQFLINHVAK